MGKGDKKTRRGKIILGTYGVRRPRKKSNKPAVKKIQSAIEKDIKVRRPERVKAVEKEVVKAEEVQDFVEVDAIQENETAVSEKVQSGPVQSDLAEVKPVKEVKKEKDSGAAKPMDDVKETKPPRKAKTSDEEKPGKAVKTPKAGKAAKEVQDTKKEPAEKKSVKAKKPATEKKEAKPAKEKKEAKESKTTKTKK